jgi:hypothetical protein
MKKSVLLFTAAAMLALSVPVVAEEDSAKVAEEIAAQADRDLCLLRSESCRTRVDSIQEKIRRIDGEIRKGTKVYSPNELARLEGKLKEAQEILESL